MIGYVNEVVAQGEQALAQGTFADAWERVAEMVAISRLDAWPLATEVVRRAGVTATIVVSVTDASGRPLQGARLRCSRHILRSA